MNDQDRVVLDAPATRPRRGELAKPGAPVVEAARGLLEFGERQRLDFEKSPRPIRIIDRETLRYLAVNDAALKLYGYSREEFLVLTLRDTRHPDEHADLLGSFEQAEGYLVPGGPRRHVKKSGEVFLAEVVTQDVRYDGRPARVSLTTDVTERSRAEDELRRQKNLLAAIIDNLPVGVFIRDAQTLRYVLRNRFCENANGYRVQSSVGLTPHDLFPKEQADLAVATDRKALETGRMVEVAEQEMLGRSGEPRLFHVRKVPLFGDDGRPWMVVGIAEDITSRKREEQERITHAFHQRDALVREVHHRIKNHLQGIAGLLRNKTGDDPGVARTIEAAVAQLQSVAVVYGLQSELAESGVPLRRMLEAICASAEGLSNARVVRRFPAAGGRIRLAETEAVPVAVALNELVFNAIEHGKRRAGSPVVEVALTEKKNGAEIRIVNRGRLPARFDYARGIGTGTGLDLVRTLLGPASSALAYGARDGKVEVTLNLREPLVAARKRAARKRVSA